MSTLEYGTPTEEMERLSRMLEDAAQRALERRLASGVVLTYELDSWVVEEHPGGCIKRLARVGEFRAADFPYPGFLSPSR